jgi:cytochrome c peroxidase
MQRGTWRVVAGVCAMVLGAVGFAHAASTGKGLDLCSSKIDIASLLPGGGNEDPDVAATNAETQANFAAALAQMRSSPPEDLLGQLELLGKLALNDYSLSVSDNLACTLCHRLTAGFTGGVSLFNQTIVAQPGSVPITNAHPKGPNVRISPRKPQTYSYAPFWPILHYDATQEDFYGGNFWDMRATGVRLGNPAAEQAQGPPVNPLEMAFPDTACAVYRLSKGPYRKFFEQVWGAHSFAIKWPNDVETVFDGGLRRAQTDFARAGYDASVGPYRQTILTAFQAVEDNPAALRILGPEAQVQDEAVQHAHKSVTLTTNGKDGG